jgi:hypothetical protein
MSVNQTDTIDNIGTTPDGKVTLTISGHHSWDELWLLELLQDKINAYLQFIESGQILDDYPNAVGREIVIKTVMKFEPNEEATSFFKKAKEVVTKRELDFNGEFYRLTNSTAKINY